MNFHKTAFFLLAGMACTLAIAHETGGPDCTRIEDDRTRLACFDAAHGAADAAAQESIAATEVASAEKTSVTADDAAGRPTGLGSEQVSLPPVDRVEARLVGDFTGWDGNTVFELDNGQVWQQKKNYLRPYTPREPMRNPRITIEKGFFGGYNLRVEGVKRIVQVRRIK